MKYKSMFISDIHLGTKGCKADLLCKFLKENDSENLFLEWNSLYE
jgi:UDP-2,3-diacylglucosamine pyrophosphatase LpxH